MSRERESRCVGCGCRDSRACPGGCAWAKVDVFAGVGVCTRCIAKPNSESFFRKFKVAVAQARSARRPVRR